MHARFRVAFWLTAIVGVGVVLVRPATWASPGSAEGGAEATVAPRLRGEVRLRYEGVPLVFDESRYRTAGGQQISVARLDLLISDLALRATNGSWVSARDRFVYVSGREGRTGFALSGFGAGRYDRVRFHVGVPPAENHASPGRYEAGHALNPNVNGLHWSWQGGYVFLALEGRWGPGRRGYAYHLATDAMLTSVELPVTLDLSGAALLRLDLDVAALLGCPHAIDLGDETASTHSRAGDPLARQLRENLARAFAVTAVAAVAAVEAGSSRSTEGGRGEDRLTPLIASNATPHPVTFPEYFPRPTLPRDNPLTEEGIALGRRLFHDPRLSVNGRQSCASCHPVASAMVDVGRRFSVGAEGREGTRNSMSLLNLAWKERFFWDGRAASLRAQVLMPIENPVEMHEQLAEVVAKLERGPADGADRAGFSAAFGTPAISADRIARALEQFLLAQISRDAKFDRVLSGAAVFTDEEQRGFVLFHTEYDPRRGQFGADCFHCHGGPLFRSQHFANNGLDAAGVEPGRYAVTGREGDQGKFAVPSLRNVAVTGPYMHDGRFATLDAVIDHYAGGVRASPTLDPNLAKHPAGGVPLTEADRQALAAFLRTLTDEAFRK